MSFVQKTEDGVAVEVLVDNLALEGGSLTHQLSTSDFEQLSELSHDISSEMESQDELSTIEPEEMHEVILPGHEADELAEEKIEVKQVKSSLPPLRPLTIAPKPAKVPISFKPMAGQQLLLVQGGTPGQQIKLVSPGQGINLSNLTLTKPLSVKTTKSQNTIPVMQKQLVMKKVVTQVPKSTLSKVIEAKPGQQIVVVQKSEPQQQLKFVQTTGGGTLTSSTTKTLTLAQAQQMGIISGSKIVPQSGTKQIILNKNPTKTIKIVPQTRSPTKILPAPQSQMQGGKVSHQRIILKPSSSSSGGTVIPSQILQVAAGAQGINSGQLHQINIPGKGMQYIKFITTTQAEAGSSLMTSTKQSSVTTKVIPVTTTTNVKTGNVIISELKTVAKHATITPKPAKSTSQIRPVSIALTSTTPNQVVVLPANFVNRPTSSAAKVPIPAIRHIAPATTVTKTTAVPTLSSSSSGDAIVPNITPTSNQAQEIAMETNGMRPRKPCNCTKSQCLKLYCDCFANGEFCYMCNCMNCYNNLVNEEYRQRAIKNCLERNPHAFRPKIGKAKESGDAAVRKHTKGCNCKRSGCLKNYCECYEAKIACSSNCKCMGCRNIEDALDKKSSRSSLLSESSLSMSPQGMRKSAYADAIARSKKNVVNKQAFNYITNAVIEATTQCLLTLANNAEDCGESEETCKKQLVEEFGRCLKQIIDCSIAKNQQGKA